MTKDEQTPADDLEQMDDFDGDPKDLREDDEITDAEEAFMEGYEKDADEEEEEVEEKDEFDI